MRLGLIGDIHGNLGALDAVLGDLARTGVDRIVCLGDVAATGPQPRETVARLRELGCPVVLGNADAWLLAPVPAAPGDGDGRRIEEIDRWCAAQLGPVDLDYLKTFQATVELSLGDGRCLLCYHGSPQSYDDVIKATTPDEDLDRMLAGRRAAVMAGGHWHFQMLRRYQDVLLINPGSVGLAYDLPPNGEVRVPAHAEFAVLTAADATLGIEFRHVPYDQEATVRAMFERGMPHANWWTEGWADGP